MVVRESAGLVFFFKQKTAYELRISDWSSDVCSSDLCADHDGVAERLRRDTDTARDDARLAAAAGAGLQRAALAAGAGAEIAGHRRPAKRRSEEHTSELQSLMRISYAVFCLKKKHPDSRSQHIKRTHISHNTHINYIINTTTKLVTDTII